MATTKRTRSGPGRRVSSDLFHPVRTRRTFEDVVGQIVELIQSGQLKEGDFLPGERTLASAMQVGRPTVRLAIELLAEAGVVAVHPGRVGGIQLVSMWMPDQLLEKEQEAMQPAEIFEALEARRTLEPRVAQLASLRATEADFAQMQHAIELQRDAGGKDWRKAVQADMLFHRLIWRAGRNKTLERMMGSIVSRLSLAIDMAMRTGSDHAAAVAIHERTLGALMRGNMAAIDQAMDEHMSYLEHICEDVFGRARLREVPDFLQGGPRDGNGATERPARAVVT